jgi:YVTN family beta-propeller protein
MTPALHVPLLTSATLRSRPWLASMALLASVLSPVVVQAQTQAQTQAQARSQPTSPIFVLNSLDATISIIDPQTYKEIRRVPTGKEPHHLYLTPDEKSLMVANALGDSLTLLDPKTGEVQRVID